MAEPTVGVGVGVKATDRSGLDLIKDTAASLEQARNSIAKAQKQGGLKKVIAAGEVADVKKFEESAAAVATKLLEVESALEKLSATDAGFAEKTKEAEKYKQELVDIAEKTNAIPTKIGGGLTGNPSDNNKGVAGKEQIGQTLGGLGGLASVVSPEAGQAAQVLNQLLQVGDGFKKLSSVLIESPGIIGSVASAAAAAAAPLGATAAGLAAVAAILLPVAIAVAGLALVVSHLNDKAKEGEKAAQAYIDALDGQIKIDREIAELLKSGDVEAAKKRYKQLQDAQTDANATLTYLYQQKADIDKKYADAQKNLNLDQLSALGSEGGKIKDEIDKVYKDQFLPAKTAVDEFGKSMDAIGQAGADKQSVEDQIKTLQQRAQVETQLADIIRKGNDGAIKDRRQAIEDELTGIQNTLPGLKALAANSDEAAKAVKDAESRQKDLTNELELYSPAAEKAAQAQSELNKAAAASLAGFVSQIQVTQQVAGLVKQASTTALTDRLESLNTERDAINSQLGNIKELAKTNADAAAKAKEYETRLGAINDEFSQLSSSAPEVRAAEVQKGLDELVKAETETDRKIQDIRTAGLAKVAAIEAQFSDARAKALDKRTEALTKANESENTDIGKIDSEYMRDERIAWDKFRKDAIKSDTVNAKARLRIIDDTNQKLLDAEKANDVIAFIAASQAGVKQLADQKDSADQAAQDRQSAFEDERKQAAEQRDQRIADIRTQAQTQRDEAQKQYKADLDAAQSAHDEALKQQADSQAQLIAAEEAGLLKRISAIQTTYNLEDGLIQDIFDKRKARYGEDDKIINDRLDLELQRHAEDLKIKADAEIKENQRAVKTKSDAEIKAGQQTAQIIGQNFGQTITFIQSGLSALISSIKSQITSNINSSGSFGGRGGSTGIGSGGKGGLTAVAFANEGVVTKPTFALIGEKLGAGEAEAVIKYKQSEGLPASMRGEGGNHLSIASLVIGSDISRMEVEGLILEGFGELADGLKQARSGTG